MNKNNAAEFLPLVQALADGKVIQIRRLNGSWVDMKNDVTFGFYQPSCYRVKPDPEVVYFVYDRRGGEYCRFDSEASAANTAAAICGTYKKFVEVT